METRLRKYLASGGLTQAWLAGELGCTPMAVSNYVTGSRGLGLVLCRKIVDALNRAGVPCELDDVFPPAGERATVGVVTRYDLRPDVFGDPSPTFDPSQTHDEEGPACTQTRPTSATT